MNQQLDSQPVATLTALPLHGLSQREIAAKTNTPPGAIKTRLELGLRKVRALVIASGGQAEWSLAA
jgi:DNA-directed RNA polymerase specialized sigma24 family protein